MDRTMTIPLLLLLLVNLCNAGNEEETGVQSNRDDMTTTILKMNNGSSYLMFQGDIMLPPARSAKKCWKSHDNCLWPRRGRTVEIPFVLSDKYDSGEKFEIHRAMRDLESVTCIRYIPRRRQTAYLSIEPKFGCSSLLGYMGDKQLLSLQRFGCVTFGIIQHELLHALGFYHEHARSDRDRYIKIHWDNIDEYYKRNFEKMDTNNLGTYYDYGSIMHYGRTAFGKSGAVTMTPFPRENIQIGQRDKLSRADIERINKLYKCGHIRG